MSEHNTHLHTCAALSSSGDGMLKSSNSAKAGMGAKTAALVATAVKNDRRDASNEVVDL